MFLPFCTLTLCAWFACTLSAPPIPSIKQETVDSLILNKFIGRWYQMYTSHVPYDTYMVNQYCIIADFKVKRIKQHGDNVDLGVTFSATTGSPSGEVTTEDGVLHNPHFRDEPGKFEINILDTGGPYWIIALGAAVETEKSDGVKQYPWVVISDDVGHSLFIFARDPATFKSKYEDKVLHLVRERGFNTPANKPIRTFQSKDECNYPSGPKSIYSVDV